MPFFDKKTQDILTNPAGREVIYGKTDRSNDHVLVQLNDFLIDHGGVNHKQKVLFFSAIKLLVNSGVSFIQALKLLSKRQKNVRFKRIITTMIYDMSTRGYSFSKAMGKYPNVFSTSETKMVYAGELTGKLESSLDTIATQMEKNIAMRMKIQSAMMYPLIVIIAIILAGIVTMIFIVPQFMDLFSQFGEDQLPIPTKVLIFLSDSFINLWWIVFPLIFAVVFWFLGWKKSETGKPTWDKFLLNAPLIGGLVNNIQTTKITGNLSTLMDSGIPVIKALISLRDIIPNQIIADSIQRIQINVSHGMPIHEAFAQEPYIDEVIPEILEVGEQTGSIPEVLRKLAIQYEAEVDHQLKNLATTIEPVIILFVATAVISLAMAILLPIFQMQEMFDNVG